MAYVIAVQNLHTSDFTGNNVESNRSFVRCQHHIAMTGTISAVWLRLSVKRRTEFVPTAATVESIQVGELGREFRLPRLGEEPPKVRVRTPDDLGKVIGREERTAKAIRTPLGRPE